MHYGSSGYFEALVFMGLVGALLIGITDRVRRARRRGEMEHLERMKALEMGLVLPPSGLDWPAAAVCIAIGAGVPIGSFLVALVATLSTDVPSGIWVAPVFVSFAALGASRKLAYRVIDPKSYSRKDLADRAAALAGKNGAFDPDAYDVVGSRG